VGRVPKLGQTMTVYNDNQVGVIVAVYALGTVDVEVTSGAGKGRRYRLTGLPFIARGADVCRA